MTEPSIHRALLALAVALALLVPPASALAQQQFTVRASIDVDGQVQTASFVVPAGGVARNFTARIQSSGLGIGGGVAGRGSLAIVDTITNAVVFSRQPSGATMSDAPVPLSDLELPSGTYRLQPGGGKRTYVTLEFELATATAGPGSVTAYLDADCRSFEGTIQVPAGMQAVGLSSRTTTSGLPCSGPVFPDSYGFTIQGPGVSYRYDVRGGVSNEVGGPLSALVLGPGTHTVRAGGGKLTYATLTYDLVPLAGGDPTPLPPGIWTPMQLDQGRAGTEGDAMCIESMQPGSAWFAMTRNWDNTRPYSVQLEFQVRAADNHWIDVWNDGFVAVVIDWGTDLKNRQPGRSWDVSDVLLELAPEEWYTMRLDARPAAGEFDVWVDGVLQSTATGIEPGAYLTWSGGNQDPDIVFVGEWAQGDRDGTYNRGSACWRNIFLTPDGSGHSHDPGIGLLVNPSFEEGPPAGGFRTLAAGSGELPGWTVTRETIDLIGTHWTASDGIRSIDLNGTPGVGAISQTFDTVPGRGYRLTFDVAGNPDGGGPVMHLTVRVAGETRSFSFDTTGRNGRDMGWRSKSMDFTARSDRTTLEFLSAQTDNQYSGPAVDNVRVTER